MKLLYTKIIVSVWVIMLLITGALVTNVASATGYNFVMWWNLYNCADPSSDGYDVDQNKCYSWCFVEETKVTMADWSSKNIEDVIVWDWLKGSIGPNRVEFLVRKFNDWKVYSFNGGRYFVTDSHPFQTTDGWKSINPEATKLWHPDLEVWKLEIGDILVTEDGNVELQSLDGKNEPQEVYTFGVNGTHDYYADGYLVHNKYPPNIPCPTGWFSIEDDIYDWYLSTSPQNWYNCFGRDLWPAVLIWSGWGVWVWIDAEIISMLYYDKNANWTYDSGVDRPLILPTFGVSDSGAVGYPYYLTVPFSWGGSFLYNNSINIAQAWMYNIGIAKGSSAWLNLMNQWFSTNDAITGRVLWTGFMWITWMQVWLDYTCNWSGVQTLAFIEYSCPAGYIPSGSSCWTGSVVSGGPCTSNNDCTSAWTCIWYSYTPPNSVFKYSDAWPWNSSHYKWNEQPYGGIGYCRNGDPAYLCTPNYENQSPNWYGGWISCGCTNFIPNNDGITVYGACTTSSNTTIPFTEVTVTDTVTCTGTGGGGWGGTGSCANPNFADYSITGAYQWQWAAPNYWDFTITRSIAESGYDALVFFRVTWSLPVDSWSVLMASGVLSVTGEMDVWNYPTDVYVLDSVVWLCGGSCSVITEAPVVCDLNDPLMAWICYLPGWFGTTLLVSNGMVGINTVAPEYALDVDSTLRAGQVLTLSDVRLKSSIEKIDNALEKIRAINWYAFTWKDSGKPDLWVLAQEIEKVFADAVNTDKNGKKSVQYNSLIAPIIEAIHELNTTIDTLYNEKFDNQVKRIEAIENSVK